MPLIFILIFMTSAGLLTYSMQMKNPTHQTMRETGTFDPNAPAGSQLTNKASHTSFNTYNGPSEDDARAATLLAAETAVLRTCRVIATLAKSNSCPAPRQESVVWSFLGGLGTKGTLASVLVTPSASQPVFTCAGIQAYGRKLLSNSLSPEFVQNGGAPIRFDLSGMQTTSAEPWKNTDITDPCGYENIVSL